MMSVILTTPHEMAKQIATRVRMKRLSLNFSQHSLSERSGVSLGAFKKFERTGKISLESLLKIAVALDCLGDFITLFKPSSENPLTLDAMINEKIRKRGRK